MTYRASLAVSVQLFAIACAWTESSWHNASSLLRNMPISPVHMSPNARADKYMWRIIQAKPVDAECIERIRLLWSDQPGRFDPLACIGSAAGSCRSARSKCDATRAMAPGDDCAAIQTATRTDCTAHSGRSVDSVRWPMAWTGWPASRRRSSLAIAFWAFSCGKRVNCEHLWNKWAF